MASPVLVDIPGIGSVEAKNAASEFTLNEILKILKKFEKQKLAGGKDDKGKGGGPNSAGGPKANSPEAKKEEDEKKKSTSTFAKLANTTRGLVGGFVGLGEATTQVIQQFANVGDSLTAAAGVFSKVPLVGTMFSAVAAASESVVKSYQDAAASGATFGGSVNNFSRAASQAGMTMDQFGAFLKSNGQALLGFGGTTEQGAKRFAQVSKELRNTGSELYALGYGTKEINQGLANYGALLKAQGTNGKQTNAELAKSTKTYLKEVDALAKITGVERSAKEAEMMAAAKDAQFQGAMAGKSKEVRESFLNTLGGLAGGMQGPLGNFAKDILATGTATTDENQKLLAQMPKSGALLQQLRAKMQKGEAVSEAERNALNNLMAEEGAAAAKQLGGTFAAAPEFAGTMNALTLAQSMQKDALTDATAEQKEAKNKTDKMNEAISKSKETLAAFSNSFQMALANSGLLDLLMKAFEFTANLVMTYLVPAFQIMANIVTAVGSALIDILGPIITQLGEFIRDHVVPAFMDLWPTIQAVGGIINDYVLPAFTAIGGFILDNILPILVGLGAALGVYLLAIAASTAAKAFNTLTTVAETGARTGLLAGLMAQISATWAAAAAALGLSAPMLAVVVAVGAVVAIFYALYKNGWTLGTAFEAVKDNLARFGMSFMEMIDFIRNKLPNDWGGISDDEKKLRDEERSKRRAELDEKEKERDKERAAKAKERGYETKEEQQKKTQLAFETKKLGHTKAEVATLEKKQAAEQGLNLNDPHALLKGLAAKEGSAFAKDPNYTGTTPTATAAAEAVKEQKKEEAKKPGAPGSTTPAPGSNSPANEPAKPAGQETQFAGMNALNSNVEKLIALQRQTNSLLNNQLRVQESMNGNITGDVFAAVG
jgi:hypothetical protein